MCQLAWPQTHFARDGIRFVVSGIYRGGTFEAGGHSGSRNRLFSAATLPQLAQTTLRARRYERCGRLSRPGHVAQTPRINNPVAFGADLNGPRTSRVVLTNTTAIPPIDMEVKMVAIQWIWMAFVALSTVFAAILWATIIAEFWKGSRLRLLALRSLGQQRSGKEYAYISVQATPNPVSLAPRRFRRVSFSANGPSRLVPKPRVWERRISR
jgi:hypothetical protein